MVPRFVTKDSLISYRYMLILNSSSMRHLCRAWQFCLLKSTVGILRKLDKAVGFLLIISNLDSCAWPRLGGLFVCRFILTRGNLVSEVVDRFGMIIILSSLQ